MKCSANLDKHRKHLEIISPKKTPPIVSVVGNSGSGKTTLLEKLIAEFKHRGFCVGTIKHDVHGFEIDRPGKDSWRHKQAGASTTIISSPYQIGMAMDVDHDHNPEELMPLLYNMDIILTEGYKKENFPKLEVFRPEVHKAPLFKDDKTLLALISDVPIELCVPIFSTGDIKRLADFLIIHFNLIRAPLPAPMKAPPRISYELEKFMNQKQASPNEFLYCPALTGILMILMQFYIYFTKEIIQCLLTLHKLSYGIGIQSTEENQNHKKGR